MTYISDKLRQEVRQLAQRRCEYCLLDERCTGRTHEVDHICAEKHGGETIQANLCLSCFYCNRHKGSDLCAPDNQTGELVALFNPRQHIWIEHFRLEDAYIMPLTATGRVTQSLLQINVRERLEERQIFLMVGRYPVYSAE